MYLCLASLNVEAGTDCGQHFLFIYDYLLFPGSLFPSHNSTVLVPGIRKIGRKGTEHCWRLLKSCDFSGKLKNMPSPDCTAKVVMIGDSGVGKSKILSSYNGERFNPTYMQTRGDFRKISELIITFA